MGAAYRLPHRLPSRGLVLSTGVAGALFGAFLTHTALGSGHFLVILAGAVIVSAALLSLLLRPAEDFAAARRRRDRSGRRRNS